MVSINSLKNYLVFVNLMKINKFKKIVIKIGSSSLINSKTGKIKKKWLNSLSSDIAKLIYENKKVVIVSSGSIALGKINISNNFLRRIEEKQAAAAIGQIELVNSWKQSLKKHGINSAQILLTLDDSEVRRRYLNVRKTIFSLHKHKIIPIMYALISYKIMF